MTRGRRDREEKWTIQKTKNEEIEKRKVKSISFLHLCLSVFFISFSVHGWKVSYKKCALNSIRDKHTLTDGQREKDMHGSKLLLKQLRSGTAWLFIQQFSVLYILRDRQTCPSV